jgi:hypothetical protein
MVTDHPIPKADVMTPSLMAVIRRGLESLTVMGPSKILNSLHARALKAVMLRPSQQEREMMLNQAWLASSRAKQEHLKARNRQALLNRETQELYKLTRQAISASRLSS